MSSVSAQLMGRCYYARSEYISDRAASREAENG
jgi:hypothetical protein